MRVAATVDAHDEDLNGKASLGLESIDLGEVKPQSAALEAIPSEYVLRYQVLPVYFEGGTLVVAVGGVEHLDKVDELSVLVGKSLKPVLADPGQIRDKIEERFLEGMMEGISQDDDGPTANVDIDDTTDLADLQRMAGEAAVVQMVNLMFAQAVRDRVSDIHIEPYEREVKVRFRVDGILHEVASPPKRMQAAIASRIKILAELNIAERRLPQDGRIKLNIAGRQVDVRVSIVPTVQGERVVMRILDKGTSTLTMEQLGMRPDQLTLFRKLINIPYGMILVTGPTGSGKSTT
ncbi:MAG: Flp pilus assembly complex ATPase component TadA, partial [Armatimonadetes bacterium]|nr:Flp pilus assembly complex ATPase component TadA [Armatimonadota bacterium]